MRDVRKPYYSHNDITLFYGNALDVLAEMEPESVHCCVTSPPYFSLRDYGVAGQIGLEDTPDEFIARLVEVFREVRRVLRPEGSLWVNCGDSYASNWPCNRRNVMGSGSLANGKREARPPRMGADLKEKDLIGIPWLLAFALRADGWWLRSEITWCKKAPMPESATDRPTSATEKLFLFAKSSRYFYDHVAVRQPSVSPEQEEHNQKYAKVYEASDNNAQFKQPNNTNHLGIHSRPGPGGRNLWNYWLLGPEPSSIPHYATFPTKLVEPCILAGSSEKGACPECGKPWQRVTEKAPDNTGYPNGPGGYKHRLNPDRNESRSPGTLAEVARYSVATTGWQPTCKCPPAEPIPCTVLDPFCGVGTTGVVSIRHRRKFVGIDLKREYLTLAIENMDGRPIRLPLEVS